MIFSRISEALHGGASEPTLKKLRNRLLFINLVCLSLVLFVAFTIIYLANYNRTQSEINQSLLSIPQSVVENLITVQQEESTTSTETPEDGDRDLVISGGPRIPVDYSKSFVANIDTSGKITIFSMLDMEQDDYVQAIETAVNSGENTGSVHIAGRTWKYNLSYAGEGEGPARVATYALSVVFLDIDDAKRGLGELALSLIIIGVIAVSVIFLISLIIANRAIRPVEESMLRQKRFIADASHELRTPIAIIEANAEAAKGAADPDVWVDNISDEAIRMNGLVENLLAMAKSEENEIFKTDFDLVDLICEEADRIEAFLFEKNISFGFELRLQQGEKLLVNSDREKVRVALSVLLENAAKYTPEGGQVSIIAGKAGGGTGKNAFVSVTNTGAYITPETLEHIFDRFYRADQSRNSESGGYGIGLSIAKAIALALGGDLCATSERLSDESGENAVNTFTLKIPS